MSRTHSDRRLVVKDMLSKTFSCKSYLFLFATEYLISAVLMVKGIDSRGQLHIIVRIPRMAVHKIRFSVQFYHSDISMGYLHETEGELMVLFCPGPCIRVTAYTRQDLGIWGEPERAPH